MYAIAIPLQVEKLGLQQDTYLDTIANDAGCDSIITFNVFIGDTTLPTVITQNITLYLDTSGNTSTTASAINNGSSDNCSIKSMTLSKSVLIAQKLELTPFT